MAEAATTKLSSRGQVVIPEEIRNRLGLEPGVQFVVGGDRDVVILKVLQARARSASSSNSAMSGGRRSGQVSRRGMSRTRSAKRGAVLEGRTRWQRRSLWILLRWNPRHHPPRLACGPIQACPIALYSV
jgi:AbrB family looped-hinge helix DNA binding protein